MSVWAVSMVKDEADVIEQTLRHLYAQGLDGCIVLDNQSTDGTRSILDQLAAEWDSPRFVSSGDDEGPRPWLKVIDDPEVGYWQSAKMTSAARAAGQLGATWVIPFDADEIWTCHEPTRTLADWIMLSGDTYSGQAATLYDHYATSLDEGSPGADFDDPFTRMAWRSQTPLPLPKVVVRVADLHQIQPGNHGAVLLRGEWLDRASSGLVVHHFPYRSPRQMISKVRNGSAAYAATNLPRTTGQHWREMGETLEARGEAAIEAWWRDAFYYETPAESGLVYDPAPVSREVLDA